MKNSTWIILIAVALAAGLGGYWFGASHGRAGVHDEGDEAAATQPSEDEKPVVPVVTATLTPSRISETATAYGTVVAEGGNVRAVSVPFEARIGRIMVTPGQQVTQGAPLVQLEASPDALVALQEAKNAVAATANDLKQTEQRVAEHLATNVELSQARQAAEAAKLKLDSLTQRGVGQNHELKAEFAGIVSKVDVQDGQIVPAGSPLVELAAGNRIEVRLNVEPSDAQALKPGADVQLQPVDGAKAEKPIAGKVRMIAQRVDPATRLIEVRVSLPADIRLMLDSFVTGRLTRAVSEGLIVPRGAALPTDDGGYALFTVKDHHAVQHVVKLGLQDDQRVQVIGDDLKAGDVVVVRGNYLLEDGSEVEVTAATQPATEPAAAKPEASQ